MAVSSQRAAAATARLKSLVAKEFKGGFRAGKGRGGVVGVARMLTVPRRVGDPGVGAEAEAEAGAGAEAEAGVGRSSQLVSAAKRTSPPDRCVAEAISFTATLPSEQSTSTP